MMRSTREGFGQAICEAAKKDPQLVVFSADLSGSLQLQQFKKEFPKRYVEVGISEQNMASLAAGMAMTGLHPVITSFAAFNPGRNWEQIRVSICEQKLNVKIVGSHAGLSASSDGGTHQALEDVALTTVLPGMTVVEPADFNEAVEATRALLASPGLGYLRLARVPVPTLPDLAESFQLGRGRVLHSGDDATFIACGTSVHQALLAREKLQTQGIDVGVVDLPTLKPLDEPLLLSLAQKNHPLIIVHEHQITGGLGSLVATFLSQAHPARLTLIGVADRFGQSGSYQQLLHEYGLDADHLVDVITKACQN